MNGFKQECKLCGNVIREENYKIIQDATKTILNIVSLKLIQMLDNDTQSVICTTCSSKLLEAFNFKSACLYTDKIIIPYVDFENPKLMDLKDISAKETGSIMLDDQEICRLCLQPMSSDHKSIQEVPVDSIQIYLPEINFAITTNPTICLKCQDALRVHSSFMRNCLDVEEKRNTDVGDMLLTNPCVKMEEIEIKSEQTDEIEDLCNLKKEKIDEKDASLHFPNGLLDTKILYDLDDLKQTSAQSTVAREKSKECVYKATGGYKNTKSKSLTVEKYRCHMCTFSTKYRTSFMRHQLIHKDPSEVQIYACDECDYKSIRKGDLRQHKLKHKDPSEVPGYKCDECDYKCIKRAHFQSHQLRHKDRAQVKMFKCDECDYKNTHKVNLLTHQMRHKNPSEVQMFECDECDYKSIRRDHLNRHQLKHKNPAEVQRYTCGKCKFVTKYKESLIKHDLQHKDPSEVPMFKCDDCDYKSVRKFDIKKHQLIHRDASQVQMYRCDICKFSTKHKRSLIQHYSQHKDPSEVRMFECDECDYKIVQKANLLKH